MATPTEHVFREIAAYLRGPAGLDTFAFTTTTNPDLALRDGVYHAPRMLELPSPREAAPDDFGIMVEGDFEIEIVDEPSDDDWPLLDADGNFLLDEDGTSQLVHSY